VVKKLGLILAAIAVLFFAYRLVVKNYFLPKQAGQNVTPLNIVLPRREVIGFMPYWLLNRAQPDYSRYVTTLTYFSLSLDEAGKIQKFTNPGESEPGYLALTSGKFDPFLNNAKAKNMKLSLAVFSYGDEAITEMLNDPDQSAKNLLEEVTPLMVSYGFTDLNLDIEQVQDASPSARQKFTRFVQIVKNNLDREKIKTLSIDVSASAFVKETNLADPKSLEPLVDQLIIMAYDYHYTGSSVTGAVAPGEGAGTVSELDTLAVVKAAKKIMPVKKIVLGIPLYGYEWETLRDTPRSAVIPSSGLIISNSRAEEFLAGCGTCSAVFDETDKEMHIIYEDQETGTFHQVFYPERLATQYKVDLAKEAGLGGMAVWALGYEGTSILEPLAGYHH
jgi:spore germination protein YaaH